MSRNKEIRMDDLYAPVSFGGGGSSSGGSSSGGGSRNQQRRNDFHRNRNANRQRVDFSGAIGVLGDGLLGKPGDNPDMGAMSDANRGQNSRPTFRGGGFGGRGGGGK